MEVKLEERGSSLKIQESLGGSSAPVPWALRDSSEPVPWEHQDASKRDEWEQEDSQLIALRKNGSLWSRIKISVLKAYNYIIRLRGSPEEIAWGFSLGLFIAMSPTIGLQMTIAVFVATVLRGNPAAAAAACWLTNPLTIPFFYGLTYWVGAFILGYDSNFHFREGLTLEMLLAEGGHVWWSLIVGGVVLGLLFAVAAYYPTLYMVRAGRAAFLKRRERRRARREARALARVQATVQREVATRGLEPEL